MYQSATEASTGIAPADCAPSTSSGTPVARLISASGSTCPLSQSTCESAIRLVRGVTSSRIARSDSAAGLSINLACLIRAPEASRGIERPGCSASVVTTSSSGPRRRPLMTMLQPSVVEAVSSMLSAGTPISDPIRARSSVSAGAPDSHVLTAPRPRSSATACAACIASTVRRERGPTEPAFR